jgi:hypothetical protein
MRRQFCSDWEKINLCNECSYAYKGGSCINEIIADAFFFKSNGRDQVKSLGYVD